MAASCRNICSSFLRNEAQTLLPRQQKPWEHRMLQKGNPDPSLTSYSFSPPLPYRITKRLHIFFSMSYQILTFRLCLLQCCPETSSPPWPWITGVNPSHRGGCSQCPPVKIKESSNRLNFGGCLLLPEKTHHNFINTDAR